MPLTITDEETAPIPELDGFTTNYGVPVCRLGEDGEVMVALGHWPALRVIAAFTRHYRIETGDRLTGTVRGLIEDGDLEATWARLAGECGDCDPDESCQQCEAVRDGEWWLTWATEPGPDTFPVMIFTNRY